MTHGMNENDGLKENNQLIFSIDQIVHVTNLPIILVIRVSHQSGSKYRLRFFDQPDMLFLTLFLKIFPVIMMSATIVRQETGTETVEMIENIADIKPLQYFHYSPQIHSSRTVVVTQKYK